MFVAIVVRVIMEAVSSSGTSVIIYQTKWCNIPDISYCYETQKFISVSTQA
jgi:hypothetical protein